MNTNQYHLKTKEKDAVSKNLKYEEGKLLKQEGQETLASASAAAKQQSPASPASPPSASSSPSHEFSFTISLHSSSTTVPADNNKTKTPPNSFAIDLSPADDIFFHGHLLPLHLLSHLPVSPRSSTNSLDSFSLPIRELIDDQRGENSISNCSTSNNSNNNSSNNIRNSNDISKNHHHHHQSINYDQTKGRSKSKSFSLFGLTRWRKGYEVREQEDNNNKEKSKKKLRFDITHVLKRYVRMVRPLLFSKGRRQNLHFHSQPCSFSGNLSFRNKQDPFRGRRGEFSSAPASIRTSPTNSGLLVATKTLPSSTSDSTMEELQAAIQAAIAHCKNSIAVDDKLNR